MSNAMELTTGTFEQETSSGTTLVDFWAEWCGPCRMMTPVLDELAGEYEGKAKVAKVNVDNERDLAEKFQVMSIPTLLVFKDGELKQRFTGVTSKSDLAAALDNA
jgi:thioredoxin 1